MSRATCEHTLRTSDRRDLGIDIEFKTCSGMPHVGEAAEALNYYVWQERGGWMGREGNCRNAYATDGGLTWGY